jgi:hypothetical protein
MKKGMGKPKENSSIPAQLNDIDKLDKMADKIISNIKTGASIKETVAQVADEVETSKDIKLSNTGNKSKNDVKILSKLVSLDDGIYYNVSNNSFEIMFPVDMQTSYISTANSEKRTGKIIWKVNKPQVMLSLMFLYQASQVYRKHKSEVEGFIIYDNVTNKCELFYPGQKIASANVSDWDYSDIPDGKRLLIDMHSHHTMKIDFSSTDDKSDRTLSLLSPHLSIVIKDIQNFDWLNFNNNIICRASYFTGEQMFCCRMSVYDLFNFEGIRLKNMNFISVQNDITISSPLNIEEINRSGYGYNYSRSKDYVPSSYENYFYKQEKAKEKEKENQLTKKETTKHNKYNPFECL